MWKSQVEDLKKNYRVLTYDVRGFGDSEGKNNSTPDIEDLKDILDELKAKEVYLMGHALGGVLATDFTLSYPDRVKKLVLISPDLAGFGQRRPYLYEILTNYSNALKANEKEKAIKEWAKLSLYGPDQTSETIQNVVSEYVLNRLKKNINGPYALRSPILKNPDHLIRLHKIYQPTMVLYGENDFDFITDYVTKMQQGIPNFRKEKIKNAGHMLNMEQPELVNNLLVDFLGQ